jgi:hypothetical protein
MGQIGIPRGPYRVSDKPAGQKRKPIAFDFRGSAKPEKLHFRGPRMPLLCGSVAWSALTTEDAAKVDCSRCRHKLDNPQKFGRFT